MLELDLFSPYILDSASWGYVVILRTMQPHHRNTCVSNTTRMTANSRTSSLRFTDGRAGWNSPSHTLCHIMHTVCNFVLLKAHMLSIKPSCQTECHKRQTTHYYNAQYGTRLLPDVQHRNADLSSHLHTSKVYYFAGWNGAQCKNPRAHSMLTILLCFM